MKVRFTSQRVLVLVLAAFLLACGVIFLFLHRGGTEGLYAEGTIQGEKVLEIPLGEKEVPQMWSLQEEFGVPVFLERDGGRIRFVDVDCPDHICEKTGWISMAYQSAVCMPNRTVVTVYGR